MTREEQLQFCKICTNQSFDKNLGITCKLTNEQADFDLICDNFNEDITNIAEIESKMQDRAVFLKIAGLNKRFANYLIDVVFYLLFSFLFGSFLGIFLAIFSPASLSFFEGDNKLMNYLLGFIAGMIYFTVSEYTTSRTIAKYITKTKVVTVDGEKPDLHTVLLRSLCRFIPFEAFSFLLSEDTGWHDKLSNTRVIEA